MQKNKEIHFKISEDDLKFIDQAAKDRNISRSQFFIDCALSIASNTECQPTVNKIMVHLTSLSNMVNQISNTEIMKKPMQQEVYGIWQSLNLYHQE